MNVLYLYFLSPLQLYWALLKILSGQQFSQADRNTPAKVTRTSVFIWMMIGHYYDRHWSCNTLVLEKYWCCCCISWKWHIYCTWLLWSAQLYLQRKWEEDVGYETWIPLVESEILRMAIKSCVCARACLCGCVISSSRRRGLFSKRCHFCGLFSHKVFRCYHQISWVVGPASARSS